MNCHHKIGDVVRIQRRSLCELQPEDCPYIDERNLIMFMVVVDGNSASAREIFAAAIQENRRGITVGRRSYGKGTVQTQFPPETLAGELRLTTGRFYSPRRRAMAGVVQIFLHKNICAAVMFPNIINRVNRCLMKMANMLPAVKVPPGRPSAGW